MENRATKIKMWDAFGNIYNSQDSRVKQLALQIDIWT